MANAIKMETLGTIHFGGKNRKAMYYLSGQSLGRDEVPQAWGVFAHLLKINMQVHTSAICITDLPIVTIETEQIAFPNKERVLHLTMH